MKKVYLIMALLFAEIFPSVAQVQPLASDTGEISYSDSINISFDEWRDSIFGQLDDGFDLLFAE